MPLLIRLMNLKDNNYGYTQQIIENPEIREVKIEDLVGIYVYKFKIDLQEMLLAYEWDHKQRLLLALDLYENFYRD